MIIIMKNIVGVVKQDKISEPYYQGEFTVNW